MTPTMFTATNIANKLIAADFTTRNAWNRIVDEAPQGSFVQQTGYVVQQTMASVNDIVTHGYLDYLHHNFD